MMNGMQANPDLARGRGFLRRSGEVRAAQWIGIEWIGVGDGWTWQNRDRQSTEKRALRGWEVVQERILGREYDVLILDEFTYPLHYGWLDAEGVVGWLRENRPPDLHLVITGRQAPDELVEYADLVTEMREVKHPFREQEVRAQVGVEY